MGESLTSQTIIAYSTAPESTYNTYPTTAAGYTGMVTTDRTIPVPDEEKTDDRGVIGRGIAMYPTFQRSGFRTPTGFNISDRVQVGSMAKLFRRYMGKAATTPTTVETTIAFLHKFYEQDPTADGLQLPASSVIYANNEFDHIFTGSVGSTLQFSQTGSGDPTYTLALTNSGFAKRITDLTSFGSVAVPPQDPYMYGADSGCQYTDDSSVTVNLTNPTHKLRTLQVSMNNSLITGDTRMGMPAVDATDPRRGWYRDFLHFGDKETSAGFTMGMDSDYSLMSAKEKNLVYTNFVWTMQGDFIPTSTTNRYYLKCIIPKFNLRTPVTGEDNGKATKGFTIFPLVNASNFGMSRLELQNGVATALS